MKCSQCDQRFSSYTYLWRHVRVVHDREKNFKCRLCETLYFTAVEAEHHIEHVHSTEFSEEQQHQTLNEFQKNLQLTCSICKKGGFRRVQYLKHHEMQCTFYKNLSVFID